MISKSETSDMSETAVTKEITTTTATGTITTVQEIKTTTTTKTSMVTSTITHENDTKPNNLAGTLVPRVVVIDGKQNGKLSPDSKSDNNGNNNNNDSEKVTSVKISEALPAKSEKSLLNGDKKVVLLSNAQDGKPNTTIMNIQSVCPNSKATLLKTGEKLTNDSNGPTVVVLNKEGGQLKVTVSDKGRPLREENGEEGKMEEREDGENGHGRWTEHYRKKKKLDA